MKLHLILLIFLFLAVGCSSTPKSPDAFGVTQIPAIPIRDSPIPTQPVLTLAASPSPSNTQTPLPTSTPVPTSTSTPTSSSTPSPTTSLADIAACLPTNTSIMDGTIAQVIDGDTIVIQSADGITYTVRYIGIDAPESGMPFGKEAGDANEALVLDMTVRLIQDISETDQYQRLLRYVVAGDRFLNLELVRMGLASAQSWPPDTACAEVFQAAENEARLALVGMWVTTATPQLSVPKLVILAVNKREEWVDIQNQGDSDVDLSGWLLLSERGHQDCPLSGVIRTGETLRIWATAAQGPGFSCGYNSPIWNNSEPDAAVLYDPQGVEVSRK